MTVEEKQFCLRIMVHYGAENQEMMMIEECAELITALRHNARGRATADEVIDELADVIIMAQQLSFIYGQSKIANRINDKLQRQLDRIGSEKPQPLSDVLKVVRCKDCIVAERVAGCEIAFCDTVNNFVTATDYCSKGVLREVVEVKPRRIPREAD